MPTTETPPELVQGAKPHDDRLIWMMHILIAVEGRADASDHAWSWLNAFCDDRGDAVDTFNAAKRAGLITITHDANWDLSTAYITDAGRAFAGANPPSVLTADTSLADRVKELEEENERLLTELKAGLGYMLNAKIDLDTGSPKRTALATLAGGIKRIEAAIAARALLGDRS